MRPKIKDDCPGIINKKKKKKKLAERWGASYTARPLINWFDEGYKGGYKEGLIIGILIGGIIVGLAWLISL